MTELEVTDFLLGRGGINPGIDVYRPTTGGTEQILSLESGQSVYALSISADNRIVAAGTKRGEIYLLRTDGQVTSDKISYKIDQFALSSPVLSLCFVNANILATADTAGTCILWRLDKSESYRLANDGKVICSLFCADARHLAGLSVSGELVIWDWTTTSTVDELKVPIPPESASLVKCICLPDTDIWAWPGRGGLMVLYDRGQNQIRTVEAHEGDFWAMAVCNRRLLTVGRTDSCLKSWTAGLLEPTDVYQAPFGIISAAILDTDSFKMLLVDDTGRAGLYRCNESKLELVKYPGGKDCRVVLGPDPEKVKVMAEQRKAARARTLAIEITDRIGKGLCGELESLYQELTELGYGHVTLSLRAGEAKAKDDLAGEIVACHKLAKIVSYDQPQTEVSLARYAGLLESIWQPQMATGIYKRLQKQYPDNNIYKDHLHRLTKYVKAIKKDQCVIETDIPISILAKATAAADSHLCGRYLLKADPVYNCRVHISPSELLCKFDQIRRSIAQLPTASQIDICWLSKEKIDRAATFLVSCNIVSRFGNLEFGIKFLNAGLQTLLVPVIILNTDIKNNTATAYSQDFYGSLADIDNNLPQSGWLQMVKNAVYYAIRQLISREMATNS